MSRARWGGAAAAALVAATALTAVSPAGAAPWCGTLATAERASVVGGPQVRVWYAIPSDGTDASATVAPRISAAVDTIDAWWRTQDFERAPRFSRSAFGCGPQVDLHLLRLSASAAALRPEAGRAAAIRAAAFATDPSDALTHLVLYDGPVESDLLCGQGGGDGRSRGFAVVYLGACGDVPIEVVAAHELLHAFGALPEPGPPHPCPGDGGHPCDSTGDVLYPYAPQANLAVLALDVGHDDYYAHGGSWLDVQDSTWLALVGRQVALTIGASGGGSVRFDTPGGVCATASCSMLWNAGAQATVLATPADGKRFLRWSGACAGQPGSCTIGVQAATATTAEFVASTFRLAIGTSGRGSVSGAGRTCTSACARVVESYRRVTLTARPRVGWRFVRWSGACTGSRPTCSLPMSHASAARATFARRA